MLAVPGFTVMAADLVPIPIADQKQYRVYFGSSDDAGPAAGKWGMLRPSEGRPGNLWDGLRSMDYLASRPEVDPQRLGCTGN